jgi:hypothetical protein
MCKQFNEALLFPSPNQLALHETSFFRGASGTSCYFVAEVTSNNTPVSIGSWKRMKSLRVILGVPLQANDI